MEKGGTPWQGASARPRRNFDGNAIVLVRRRLTDLEPQRPDQEDRRGFEWRLLQAFCSGELRVLQGHKGSVRSVAFAPTAGGWPPRAPTARRGSGTPTPADDATRARREAVGLVRFLLGQVESEADLRDRLAGDATVSDPVRSLALDLAGPLWRARIRREAEAINASHFARLLLRDDVLAALRADEALKPAVRAEALAQAAEWLESANDLYEASRAAVDEPGRPAAAYREALRWAEAACRIQPDLVRHLFTLGAAQYRASYPREALASLRRCAKIHQRKIFKGNGYNEFAFNFVDAVRGTGDPNDLAFAGIPLPPDLLAYQAMARHRLGEHQEARASLGLLRKHYELNSASGDRRFYDLDDRGYSNLARLREAEALILGPPPELPEEVFVR